MPLGVSRAAVGNFSVREQQRGQWRALRDSNPCYRRERAVSWTARRRARKAATYRELCRERQPGQGPYQCPVFGIEAHGSFGGRGEPFCNSSIECLSGERTNAMLPSRGGRLMVTPPFISFSQVA